MAFRESSKNHWAALALYFAYHNCRLYHPNSDVMIAGGSHTITLIQPATRRSSIRFLTSSICSVNWFARSVFSFSTGVKPVEVAYGFHFRIHLDRPAYHGNR
jgi:hypothetical protein